MLEHAYSPPFARHCTAHDVLLPILAQMAAWGYSLLRKNSAFAPSCSATAARPCRPS
jgi:hypothetical protein